MQHPGRPRHRVLARDRHARGDGTDGGELARQLAREAIGHHPAVRDAGRVHVVRDDVLGLDDLVDHRAQELHVVDAIGLWAATARARVPCPVDAVGVGDDEAFRVGLRVPPVALARLRGAAEAAVEDDHE